MPSSAHMAGSSLTPATLHASNRNCRANIFFVCPGLGHIFRGYETFTRQCFDALKDETSFRIRLFKGAGAEEENETTIAILRRTGMAAQLARLLGRNSYDAEQLSFAIGLIPHLLRAGPEVVFFSDRELGEILWQWRRISKQGFKLLFSNGGPAPPPFPRWDHIHQVSPEHYDHALRRGVPEDRQTLIPYGCAIPQQPRILSSEEKSGLRGRLGLPTAGPIVISVGMLSAVHKRMDYVVEEVHRLPEPRPYLLLLGQPAGSETESIRGMATSLLGRDGYRIATVAPEQVEDYYRIADVFALASLSEGLPRVLLEAMSAGLPCLAHDYLTTRYVVGASGYLRDLRAAGALSAAIIEAIKNSEDQGGRVARARDAYQRFSWDRLAPKYAAMISRVASGADGLSNQGANSLPPELRQNREPNLRQAVYRHGF